MALERIKMIKSIQRINHTLVGAQDDVTISEVDPNKTEVRVNSYNWSDSWRAELIDSTTVRIDGTASYLYKLEIVEHY
jgi:hypothetical protein